MRYHLFNIGAPNNDAWWNRQVSLGTISAGFENSEGDRGDKILHDLQEGDWVIAYASGRGAIGAGIVAGQETYRLLDDNELPPDFESPQRHFRSVDWIHSVSSLDNAVPFPLLQLSAAPRHTKTGLKDTDNARRIIGLISAQSVGNFNVSADGVSHIRSYFFYNTDADAIFEQPKPRFRVLIDQGFAAVGGDRKKFGEQFKDLEPSDILLMYEDEIGVVAVGKVQNRWDGLANDQPLYYFPAELQKLKSGPYEYRISVDWFLDLSDSPIGVKDLKNHLGYTPRGAVKKILRHHAEVERMIEELRLPIQLGNVSSDHSLPDRVLTTTFRIARDTEKVRRVKRIHRNECQICGRTIELPNGSRYSEGHHIKPLGSEHNGPDEICNILCVCPNHHAELDYCASPIDLSTLRTSRLHPIDPVFVEYHNSVRYCAKLK
jgi:hypothetical protein